MSWPPIARCSKPLKPIFGRRHSPFVSTGPRGPLKLCDKWEKDPSGETPAIRSKVHPGKRRWCLPPNEISSYYERVPLPRLAWGNRATAGRWGMSWLRATTSRAAPRKNLRLLSKHLMSAFETGTLSWPMRMRSGCANGRLRSVERPCPSSANSQAEVGGQLSAQSGHAAVAQGASLSSLDRPIRYSRSRKTA